MHTIVLMKMCGLTCLSVTDEHGRPRRRYGLLCTSVMRRWRQRQRAREAFCWSRRAKWRGRCRARPKSRYYCRLRSGNIGRTPPHSSCRSSRRACVVAGAGDCSLRSATQSNSSRYVSPFTLCAYTSSKFASCSTLRLQTGKYTLKPLHGISMKCYWNSL